MPHAKGQTLKDIRRERLCARDIEIKFATYLITPIQLTDEYVTLVEYLVWST
jgi:hypothetical protein